jgi:hypothetical protein
MYEGQKNVSNSEPPIFGKSTMMLHLEDYTFVNFILVSTKMLLEGCQTDKEFYRYGYSKYSQK